MKLRIGAVTAISAIICTAAQAVPKTVIHPSQLLSKPAYPVVSDGSHVLLEVWPTVKDITVSAFFLDKLDEKSRNLCESVKRSLDHDAEIRAREQQATFTSYRMCMTIKEAAALGWIEAKE